MEIQILESQLFITDLNGNSADKFHTDQIKSFFPSYVKTYFAYYVFFLKQ